MKQRWRELSKGEKAAVVVAGVGIVPPGGGVQLVHDRITLGSVDIQI